MTTTPPCAANPELWFDPNHANQAAAICQTCPIQRECQTTHDALPHALKGWGVWAGRESQKPPTCKTDGCSKPRRARGLCQTCYSRAIRHDTLEHHSTQRRRNDTPPPPCKTDGCDNPTRSRGLCHNHYEQHRRRQQTTQDAT